MPNNKSKYEQLLADGKQLFSTHYDLLRLELLDKLSQIFGLFILLIVALFLAFAVLAYLSVALVGLMVKAMPVSLACTIIAVVLLIVIFILYALRDKLFINPFVKRLSAILFKEDNETADETKLEQHEETE